MLELPPKVWKLLIFPIFAIAFFLAMFLSAYQFFYRGGYTPPVAPEIYFEEIVVDPALPEDFTDRPIFSANPVGASGRGVLLVDSGHRNAFHPDEIAALASRASDRGYAVEFLDDSGPAALAEGLRNADAFVVISPIATYGRQEGDLVVDFVERGGRLLLIADPGRPHQLNALSERLGVSFQPGYLYNLSEHDSNFQEFYVRDFQAHAVTEGIDEVIFYYAGSIESPGVALALTDENTYSDAAERQEPRSPLSIGAYRNVLAVHDLTFMIPPYNAVRDNDRLVSNIADFLTGGQKDYRLADFPGFFQDDVDILLGRPDLFDLGAEMKQTLAARGLSSQLREVENAARDTVFLGLYENDAAVARYLDSAGLRIGDSLTAPFAPGVPLEGTAVLLLHRAGDRDMLVLLAHTPDGLADLVGQVDNGRFRSGLADDFAGVYKTE